MAGHMVRPMHVLLLFVLGCTVCVRLGSAIQCYKCRSDYGGECSDPARYRVQTTDCEKQTPKATRCKKIVKETNGATVIFRDCLSQAEVQDEDGCFTTNKDDVFCRCSSDLCNASPHVKAALPVTAAGLLIALILSYLLR